MRGTIAGAMVFSLALGGTGYASSYGYPAKGFMNAAIEAAFIPLSGTVFAIVRERGAAVVLMPGIAVTNAHNASMIDRAAAIGQSTENDLLFFKTDRTAPLVSAPPYTGEHVVAYGEDLGGELRVSYGVIGSLNAPVKPNCDICALQRAFTFESNAGPGFSGGPVVDAADGHLVGIVFGYVDVRDGNRTIYAYDMARVNAEYSQLDTQGQSLAASR